MFKHAIKTSVTLAGLMAVSGFALPALNALPASASESAPVQAMGGDHHDDDDDEFGEDCSFTGTWRASDGGGNVVLRQSGRNIEGSRRAPNQRFTGKVNRSGDAFSGKYFQDTPRKSGPLYAWLDSCDVATTKAFVNGGWNYATMYRL